VEIILHRANPEGAVRADAALVKAVVGQIGLDDCKRTEVPAIIPQHYAIAKSENRASVCAQPDGGRKVWRRPDLVTLVAEKNAMNAFASNIDPKERAALIVVNRTFADDVRGLDEKRRSHALRSRAPFNRRLLSE
jgi:hypothetical protein